MSASFWFRNSYRVVSADLTGGIIQTHARGRSFVGVGFLSLETICFVGSDITYCFGENFVPVPAKVVVMESRR